MTAALRVAVVDDEPLVRQRIRALLSREESVAVVAECGDGASAVEAVARNRPDVLFLDIRMPEMDGFAVLEALELEWLPAVVFVTAYDDYALRAFEVHAVDYLLKPIDPDRFRTALARARQQAAGRRLVRFVVRQGERASFVRVEAVDWIEAASNYIKIHVGGRVHLLRGTLSGIQRRLDPHAFVRIHRSFIVNLDRVATVEPHFHGEYLVRMTDGARLTSSRTHSAALRARLR